LKFIHAITRKPGKKFAQGITSANLGKPDYGLMLKQHRVYIELLKSLGLTVIELDALQDFPDAYFVEDTAVVTPEVAILTNSGPDTRKGEVCFMEPVLAKYRKIERIEAPGTVDGGDVLMVDKQFFIGISDRTNEDGAKQLAAILEKYGYECTPIDVEAGLHLKSSVNYVGKNTLLMTAEFVEHKAFENYSKIIVNRGEEYSANTLFVNDYLITPAGFPSTKKKLEKLDLPIIELDVNEARKMDGGLTCMSIRF